jgi:hypothetical protein
MRPDYEHGYHTAINVVQRVLAAYGSQRDRIEDSDLDDEQPITLNIYLTLGDIRMARRFVAALGGNPADFQVAPVKSEAQP